MLKLFGLGGKSRTWCYLSSRLFQQKVIVLLIILRSSFSPVCGDGGGSQADAVSFNDHVNFSAKSVIQQKSTTRRELALFYCLQSCFVLFVCSGKNRELMLTCHCILHGVLSFFFHSLFFTANVPFVSEFLVEISLLLPLGIVHFH